MRISDWSSDVCSSDLWKQPSGSTPIPQQRDILAQEEGRVLLMLAQKWGNNTPTAPSFAKYDPFSGRCKALYNAGHIHYNPEGQAVELNPVVADRKEGRLPLSQIGRASCRERVCQYG